MSKGVSAPHNIKPVSIAPIFYAECFPQSGTPLATVNSVRVGQPVLWKAVASKDGVVTTNATYSWSGTDNLTGTTATVLRSYTLASLVPPFNVATATVRVTSGSQSFTSYQCSVDIIP